MATTNTITWFDIMVHEAWKSLSSCVLVLHPSFPCTQFENDLFLLLCQTRYYYNIQTTSYILFAFLQISTELWPGIMARRKYYKTRFICHLDNMTIHNLL